MKPTRKFKKGDRVVCINGGGDTRTGTTGIVKRYGNDIMKKLFVIIKRDDGKGWPDGKSLGWSVCEDYLEKDEDYVGYEVDA